jgi:hypothetical protein
MARCTVSLLHLRFYFRSTVALYFQSLEKEDFLCVLAIALIQAAGRHDRTPPQVQLLEADLQ